MHTNNIDGFDAAIVMPPPNVTGNLHIGHALNLFLQDILVRSERLFKGRKILWIPGSDHAGIATQLLVQKKLESNGTAYSKDDLNEHIWQWKEVYENNICSQIKALGVAVSWDHYTFTLDPGPQKGVVEAFCRLYEKGLIFRGNKMLNWDIVLQSVISDIETINKELDGKLYYIKYATDAGEEIEVATTRPETIFGDAAILVHPDDERYKNLVGQFFNVPLTNKKVELIADTRCEIDKGTGAVKIDPAHGFLDFEIARERGLEVEQVINKQGKMCGDLPDWVIGLDRFDARIKVAEKLQELGLISKTENIKHLVPHGARSNSVLEPMILDQWFLDMPQLQNRAIEIIQNNEIELIPSNFKSIYLEYVTKLEPWCISRQISWGHKIPAWHKDGKVYVARTCEEAKKASGATDLEQDPDVLDTWFSSALWPMLTLGWPDKELCEPLYPNEFLITGHDILFFWATKMIIMHIGLFGDTGVPFKSIKLHGLVQDEYGLKMSKSKGNVVDPLALCDEYGTDVISFALIYTASTGHNIKFGPQNIDKSKKFLNKILNAMNFCLSHLSQQKIEITSDLNHYIIQKCQQVEAEISAKVFSWNMYGAADALYDFFWSDFCSWHLELVKFLNSTDLKAETAYTLYYIMRKILKIMHPFLPVITESFWQKLGEEEGILENYVELEGEEFRYDLSNSKSDLEVDKLRKIINKVRSIRDHFQLRESDLLFVDQNFPEFQLKIINAITHMDIKHKTTDLEKSIKFGLDGLVLEIVTERDFADINDKFEAIIDNIEKNLAILNRQLNDEGFMSHVSAELIREKQKQVQELKADLGIWVKSKLQRSRKS